MGEEHQQPHSKIVPINATIMKMEKVELPSVYKYMRPCQPSPVRIEVDCQQSPKVYNKSKRQRVITLDCEISGDQIKGLIEQQSSKGCLQARKTYPHMDRVANAISQTTEDIIDYDDESFCEEEQQDFTYSENQQMTQKAKFHAANTAEDSYRHVETHCPSPGYNDVISSGRHQNVPELSRYSKFSSKSAPNQRNVCAVHGEFPMHESPINNKNNVPTTKLKSGAMKQSDFLLTRPDLEMEQIRSDQRTLHMMNQGNTFTPRNLDNTCHGIENECQPCKHYDQISSVTCPPRMKSTRTPCQENNIIPHIDKFGTIQKCVEVQMLNRTCSPASPMNQHSPLISKMVYDNAVVRQSRIDTTCTLSPRQISQYQPSGIYPQQRSDFRIDPSDRYSKYPSIHTSNMHRINSGNNLQPKSMSYPTKPFSEHRGFDTDTTSPHRSTYINRQISDERVNDQNRPTYVGRQHSDEKLNAGLKTPKKSVYISPESEEGVYTEARSHKKSIAPISRRPTEDGIRLSHRPAPGSINPVSRQPSDEETSNGDKQGHKKSITSMDRQTSEKTISMEHRQTKKSIDPVSRHLSQEEMSEGPSQSSKSISHVSKHPSKEEVGEELRPSGRSVNPDSWHALDEGTSTGTKQAQNSITTQEINLEERQTQRGVGPGSRQSTVEEITVDPRLSQKSVNPVSRQPTVQEMNVSPGSRQSRVEEMDNGPRQTQKSITPLSRQSVQEISSRPDNRQSAVEEISNGPRQTQKSINPLSRQPTVQEISSRPDNRQSAVEEIGNGPRQTQKSINPLSRQPTVQEMSSRQSTVEEIGNGPRQSQKNVNPVSRQPTVQEMSVSPNSRQSAVEEMSMGPRQTQKSINPVSRQPTIQEISTGPSQSQKSLHPISRQHSGEGVAADGNLSQTNTSPFDIPRSDEKVSADLNSPRKSPVPISNQASEKGMDPSRSQKSIHTSRRATEENMDATPSRKSTQGSPKLSAQQQISSGATTPQKQSPVLDRSSRSPSRSPALLSETRVGSLSRSADNFPDAIFVEQLSSDFVVPERKSQAEPQPTDEDTPKVRRTTQQSLSMKQKTSDDVGVIRTSNQESGNHDTMPEVGAEEIPGSKRSSYRTANSGSDPDRPSKLLSPSSTVVENTFVTAPTGDEPSTTDVKADRRPSGKQTITDTPDLSMAGEERKSERVGSTSPMQTVEPTALEKRSVAPTSDPIDSPEEQQDEDKQDPVEEKGSKKKGKKKKGKGEESDGDEGEGKKGKKKKKKSVVGVPDDDDEHEEPNTSTEYTSLPKNSTAEQTNTETTENEMKTALAPTDDTETIVATKTPEATGDTATVEMTDTESAFHSEAEPSRKSVKAKGGKSVTAVTSADAVHTPDDESEAPAESTKGGKKKGKKEKGKKEKEPKKKKEKKKGKKGKVEEEKVDDDEAGSPAGSDDEANQNRKADDEASISMGTEFLSPVSSSQNFISESAYYSVND